MLRNIKLLLRFNGSNFHGWQLQNNAETVQGQLMRAVKRITGKDVVIHGCSRTDNGVHANMFCCNFSLESEIECKKLMKGLNAVLPGAISVYECSVAEDSFHSRFDCKGKKYVYKIWNSESRNPFMEGLVLHYPYRIDAELLDSEAKDFIGTHDFSAFCSSGTDVKNKVRTIHSFDVSREGDLITLSVKGDGFLYNMVRIMVGTLLDISSGKIKQGTISDIIESKDRSKSGITAKPEGLYLNEVYY